MSCVEDQLHGSVMEVGLRNEVLDNTGGCANKVNQVDNIYIINHSLIN